MQERRAGPGRWRNRPACPPALVVCGAGRSQRRGGHRLASGRRDCGGTQPSAESRLVAHGARRRSSRTSTVRSARPTRRSRTPISPACSTSGCVHCHHPSAQLCAYAGDLLHARPADRGRDRCSHAAQLRLRHGGPRAGGSHRRRRAPYEPAMSSAAQRDSRSPRAQRRPWRRSPPCRATRPPSSSCSRAPLRPRQLCRSQALSTCRCRRRRRGRQAAHSGALVRRADPVSPKQQLVQSALQLFELVQKFEAALAPQPVAAHDRHPAGCVFGAARPLAPARPSS